MSRCSRQQLLCRKAPHRPGPRAAAVAAAEMMASPLLLLLLLLCSTQATAYVPGIAPTDFSEGQSVPVQVASLQSVQGVLPVDPYSSLSPFCRPGTIEVEESNLGQILLSDRVKNTPFELNFLKNSFCKTLCSDRLFGPKEQTFMLRLIKEHYHYQFIVDQLYVLLRHYRADGSSAFSFGTPLGYRSDGAYYLYNHFRMLLYYHSNTDAAGKQIHRIVGFEIVPYSVLQAVQPDGSLSCFVPSPSSSAAVAAAGFSPGAAAAAGGGGGRRAEGSAGGSPLSPSSSQGEAEGAGQQRPPLAGTADAGEGSAGKSSASAAPAAPGEGGNARGKAAATESGKEGERAAGGGGEELQELISEQLRIDGVTRSIAFTYDVMWQRSSTPWSQRWDAYLKNARDSPIIHWFSIVNSLVVVLLLSGIVAMIMLRVLYRDIAKYNELLVDEEEAEETGWKLLHGDVFRKPPHSTVLAALAGSGMQLIGMAFVTVVFAGLGVVSPAYRGSLLQTMLLLWTVMGSAAGYTSARLYKMFRSTHWKMTTIRTALMFPGVVFAIFFLLNLVLWVQQSSAAVSFSALLTLLMLWFGISTPLVFLGAYVGFRQPPISLPVRINKIPRQIPQQPWFMQPALCCLVGGALPFGAMFTELFFLFSSIWQHRFYYLFGFLFLVLVILCVTCAEISITFVYFQLVCEDYLWWWRSFLCSASSGVYVLLYAVYYFHSRLKLTHATGALIYFGYSLIIAYACFILTGAIGFLASFFFLRKIYGSIKVD